MESNLLCIQMWESRVEIEGYSITYFDRIVAFEVPYHWTSVKGGAHIRFVDSLDIHASTKYIWIWDRFIAFLGEVDGIM